MTQKFYHMFDIHTSVNDSIYANWKFFPLYGDLKVLSLHWEKYMVFGTIKWQVFSIVVPSGKYKI